MYIYRGKAAPSLQKMRYKTYRTHWSYLGPPIKRRELLVDFVLDVLYLFGSNGFVPPLRVLNEVLLSGGNSGGMGPGTTWRPFWITEREYAELVDALLKLDVEAARKTHPYVYFQRAVVDEELSTTNTYIEWVTKCAEKLQAASTIRTAHQDEKIIGYLNTDLELATQYNPAALLEAFAENELTPNWVRKETDSCWRMALEITESASLERNPAGTIEKMLAIIENLSGEARHVWETSSVRKFDIGYDCGDKPWAFSQVLPHSVLRRIVAVEAEIAITIYPVNLPNQSGD